MIKKIGLVILTVFLLSLFSNVSAENVPTNKEGGKNYIIMTENNSSVWRMLRSAHSYSYRVGYSFNGPFEGPWRQFAGGDICFTTNPVGNDYSTNEEFWVKLVRNSGWFSNESKGTKDFKVNAGEQRVRWTNVEAGEYRLEMSKSDFGKNWNGQYFWDNDALIENCDH